MQFKKKILEFALKISVTILFCHCFSPTGDQNSAAALSFQAAEKMGPLTLAELWPHFTRWASLQLS